MPQNERRFWEMVENLLKFDQEQSEILFGRMWVLDTMIHDDPRGTYYHKALKG